MRGRFGVVEQELAEDYVELRLGGMVEYRLSERVVARGRLEWLREDYDAADAAGDTARDADVLAEVARSAR